MLQIYKLKSQDKNYFGYSVALDDDIEVIAEFQDFEEIEKKYGNRDFWAGLELVNKEVVFNQARYDADRKSKLPLAMGNDLVLLAQQAFDGKNGLVRASLLYLFNNFQLPISVLDNIPLSAEEKAFVLGIAKAQGNGTLHFSLEKLLQSSTCNPLKQKDFDLLMEWLKILPDELAPVKNGYIDLAQKWAESVRFSE